MVLGCGGGDDGGGGPPPEQGVSLVVDGDLVEWAEVSAFIESPPVGYETSPDVIHIEAMEGDRVIQMSAPNIPGRYECDTIAQSDVFPDGEPAYISLTVMYTDFAIGPGGVASGGLASETDCVVDLREVAEVVGTAWQGTVTATLSNGVELTEGEFVALFPDAF